MTRATRRTSALVVFCVLTSAATAYAECAWVLWKQPTTSWDGDGEWELWAAYSTVTACTQALDYREAEARKGTPFTDISKRAPTDLFLMLREVQVKQIQLGHYVALPPRHDRPARAEGEVTRHEGGAMQGRRLVLGVLIAYLLWTQHTTTEPRRGTWAKWYTPEIFQKLEACLQKNTTI